MPRAKPKLPPIAVEDHSEKISLSLPQVPRVNQGESCATIKMGDFAGAWGLRA
jgi:hypothetical protein